MPHFQPTLTTTFRPAGVRQAQSPRQETRLPLPIAFGIISASSLALWVLLWKVAVLAIG